MRIALIALPVALALAACGDKAAEEPAAVPSAPATIATTNATVEPAPQAPETPEAAAPEEAAVNETSSPTPANAPPTACGADRAERFVGQQATPARRAEIIEAVGHNRIRWLKPGDAMTMDYSEGRLNVMLDADGKITGVRCG